MTADISPTRVAILVSGRGTNLQALIDGMQAGRLPIEIVTVISNRADAFGLERAKRAGVPAETVLPEEYPDRDSYDRALAEAVDACRPDLIVLAGFMRILSAAFVRHYRGHILNIHPSLLPRYRGLHSHRRALEAGDRVHGASVHFVTEELDGGPVAVQAEVPIEPGDDENLLAFRVQNVEHVIYPQAVRLFAEGRLRMNDAGLVELDGQPLTAPLPPEA